jgi:hypothetical protein
MQNFNSKYLIILAVQKITKSDIRSSEEFKLSKR